MIFLIEQWYGISPIQNRKICLLRPSISLVFVTQFWPYYALEPCTVPYMLTLFCIHSLWMWNKWLTGGLINLSASPIFMEESCPANLCPVSCSSPASSFATKKYWVAEYKQDCIRYPRRKLLWSTNLGILSSWKLESYPIFIYTLHRRMRIY